MTMNHGWIDFHAHILPGADHGSDCVETSLVQLEQAQTIGVSAIVATPHFYPHKYRNVEAFLERRGKSLQTLQEAYTGDISIYPAAEVLLCEGLQNLSELEKLCLPDTHTILIEMPMMGWSRRHIDTLFALKKQCGLSVILVHVDRYPYEKICELLGQGFLGQINVDAICKWTTRRRYLELAHTNAIVALGSDIHGRTKAYTGYEKAVSLLGQSAVPLMKRAKEMLVSEAIASL